MILKLLACNLLTCMHLESSKILSSTKITCMQLVSSKILPSIKITCMQLECSKILSSYLKVLKIKISKILCKPIY